MKGSTRREFIAMGSSPAMALYGLGHDAVRCCTHSSDVARRFHRPHLKADDMPQVNEFGSMAMYGPDNNFVANDVMRYSVGDRTAGLIKDADGSFTVYIQPDAPGDPLQRANWLSSAQQGVFHMILRTYGPKQPVIDQAWTPPAVVRT